MVFPYLPAGQAVVIALAVAIVLAPLLLVRTLTARAKRHRQAKLRRAATRFGLSYAETDLFGDMRQRRGPRVPCPADGPSAALHTLPYDDSDEVLGHVLWGHQDGFALRMFELERPGQHSDEPATYESYLVVDLQTSWPRTTVYRGGRLHRAGTDGWVMPDDPIFSAKLSLTSDAPDFALRLLAGPMRQLLVRARKTYDRIEISGRWLLIRQTGKLTEDRIDVLMRLCRDIRAHVPPHVWRAGEPQLNA